MFLLILYHRKQINYDLSDCLRASVTELRHICISKRWGSKLPLMKAAKANINKRILEEGCHLFETEQFSSFLQPQPHHNVSLCSIFRYLGPEIRIPKPVLSYHRTLGLLPG